MKIIKRLKDAAEIMREHSQYNDEEYEHNSEGLAAETCEDAAKLIKALLTALKQIADWEPSVAPSEPNGLSIVEAIDIARAAIAKAKGEPE